jgi:hypothetical protein
MTNSISYINKAIAFYSNGGTFSHDGDKIILWNSKSKKPTSKQILLKAKELKEKENYIFLRKQAYDKLNQDELRYNDLINNTNTWIEAIQSIKEQYPKPE